MLGAGALLVVAGAAGVLVGVKDEPSPTLPSSQQARATPGTAPSAGTVSSAQDADGVERLLDQRSAAVLARDRGKFLASLHPDAQRFAAEQGRVFDRLAGLTFAEWSYELLDDELQLPADRRKEIGDVARLRHVRLTYRLAGTVTRTDRDQYLTVVPREGRWLLLADDDGASLGKPTEPDLWDLGAVQLVRGSSSTVLAAAEIPSTRVQRLASETDRAVERVRDVWTAAWSNHPVVVLPRTQGDLARLLGRSDSKGLGQLAAVTTGLFSGGVARGDRVVVNPGTFATLTAVGRKVVLKHEVTHVATRATTLEAPPAWLSEGFADYVAYRGTGLPASVVAADLVEDIRAGAAPRQLPEEQDFDPANGDVAAAYEGAWLAGVMIAEKHGEDALVSLYRAVTDGAGEGWPAETVGVIGTSADDLTRQWRRYVGKLAER